jgi:hypothetical protein
LQNYEKRVLALSFLSVCPYGTIQFPLDGFSRKSVERIQVSLKCDQNMETDRHFGSRSVPPRMRNFFSDNTNFMFNDSPHPPTPKNCPFYEITWKNVEPGRPQRKMWRMRIACWVQKSTKTHSEYVTSIAILLQHWLHGRTSTLRYMYIACIVLR